MIEYISQNNVAGAEGEDADTIPALVDKTQQDSFVHSFQNTLHRYLAEKIFPEETKAHITQEALNCFRGIGPRDELEAMLAGQMVLCHLTALSKYQKPWHDSANLAIKLSKLFVQQTEALQRHRGKGQQTIRIERIDVQAGAQAAIGHIEGRR